MSVKKKKTMLSQARLREVAWEVGQNYPVLRSSDYITLLMITPGRGLVHWHINEETISSLIKKNIIEEHHVHQVVRIHDVTDIIFDGSNSHRYFDLRASKNEGCYTFGIDNFARHYIAEIGFRSRGSYHAVARSMAVFFDRNRPSGNYSTAGLFAGGRLNRTFPVENIFDAPVFERMNSELSKITRKGSLFIAVVNINLSKDADSEGALDKYIRDISKGFKTFGCGFTLFDGRGKKELKIADSSIIKSAATLSDVIYNDLAGEHEKKPFNLVHCHDWYSSQTGINARKKLKLPFVLSLHSTEHERNTSGEMTDLSEKICSIEKRAVREADLVIVPHSSTRQLVMELYDAHPEKVVIIPDSISGKHVDQGPSSVEARQWFSIPPESPVVLFSGEMSHAAGADLLLDALSTVCRNHRSAHFIFVGDGPLRGELESRAHHMRVGHRCRFTGHLSRRSFEAVLIASDFVVIPARSWQDEGLAQMANDYGKPVLATHQSGVRCIEHGKNGLLTFDNPGSIVWGVQELLHNPLRDTMLRAAARKSAGQSPSLESIAAQHYMYYEVVIKKNGGGKDG